MKPSNNKIVRTGRVDRITRDAGGGQKKSAAAIQTIKPSSSAWTEAPPKGLALSSGVKNCGCIKPNFEVRSRPSDGSSAELQNAARGLCSGV